MNSKSIAQLLIFVKIVIVGFVLSGCKDNNNLEAKDFVVYVENVNNGLRISKEIGDQKIEVQYKPLEYMSAKECIKTRSTVNKADLEDYRKKHAALQYFTLRYSMKNKTSVLKYGLSNENEYFERQNYFSFGLENDIKLIEGKDTLSCALFVFERNYNLSPDVTFEIAFEKRSDLVSDKIVMINDKSLNIGNVNIKIAKSDLENMPKLIY